MFDLHECMNTFSAYKEMRHKRAYNVAISIEFFLDELRYIYGFETWENNIFFESKFV